MFVIPADILTSAINQLAAIRSFGVVVHTVCRASIIVLTALTPSTVNDRAVVAGAGR
jgi:hypothetical protein